MGPNDSEVGSDFFCLLVKGETYKKAMEQSPKRNPWWIKFHQICLIRRDRTISNVISHKLHVRIKWLTCRGVDFGIFQTYIYRPKKITCPLQTGDHFKRKGSPSNPHLSGPKHVTFGGSVMVTNWILPIKNYSWWFQPIWTILEKLCKIGSFPQIGVRKNIQYLKPPPSFIDFFLFESFPAKTPPNPTS